MHKASGIKPQALCNKPELKEHDLQFLKIFYDLISARQVGEALGAIPPSEMLAYFQMFGYDTPEEREKIFRLVHAMDEAFLAHSSKKTQKLLDKPGSPASPGLNIPKRP